MLNMKKPDPDAMLNAFQRSCDATDLFFLDGRTLSELPGYKPSRRQALILDEHGMLCWTPINRCEEGSHTKKET